MKKSYYEPRLLKTSRKYTAPAAVTVLLGFILLYSVSASGQSAYMPCGTDLVNNELRKRNPDFDRQLAKTTYDLEHSTTSLKTGKTTASKYKVQVVFHFVLDSAQVKQLGDVAGIKERVTSQMEQLNRDWNARNPDSVKIPAAFKPLYGNMNVEFVLATKAPDGSPSPGYEIVYTTKKSYDIASGGTMGSTLGASDAKYKSTGGADAWDPASYYNVWVLNVTPVGVLGFATPPRRPPFDVFPVAEQGAVILYGAFGKKTSPGQYFSFSQATTGRTLVHETGHFFNLFHTWGSTDDCSDDDGISDTPPQGRSTPNNAPDFPVIDACSPSSPGVMFMNFMDYAVDTAQALFTKGQAAASHKELDPGGDRHSLVLPTTSLEEWEYSPGIVRLVPNPAGNTVTVDMDGRDVDQVIVLDIAGRELLRNAAGKQASVVLNIDRFAPGIYLVKLLGPGGKITGIGRLIKE